MGLAVWTNNAETTLAVQLLVGGTIMTVSAGKGDLFPVAASGDWFKCTLVDSAGNREIVKCTARALASDNLTILRGQEGTTPQQWEIDDIVSHRVTAVELGLIITDIDTNKTDIASNDSDILNHENRIAALEDYLEAPSGTKLFFYQDTPPTGWTLTAGIGDRIIAVKGGATYLTGGATAGSWTLPNYTLLTADIPSHTHGSGNTGSGGGHGHNFGGSTPRYGTSGADGSFGSILGGGGATSSANVTVASVGGHTHSINNEGGGGAHNHGATYRPAAAVGIIASKD